MIDLAYGCCDKLFPNICELHGLGVYIRVIITRLENPLQVLWLIGYSWSLKITGLKITDFWGSK